MAARRRGGGRNRCRATFEGRPPTARSATTHPPAAPDRARCGYSRPVLLSDRDIRAEIDAGRLGIEPFDDSLIQPSSVDVRLDSLFRVFNNTRYTHIDPAQRQDDLTSLVEPKEGEPFVLHPGEFVLGATLERCTLPDDLAGRLEEVLTGSAGAAHPFDSRLHRPRVHRPHHPELSNVANLPITLWPGMKIGQLCLLRLTSPAQHPYGSSQVGSKYQASAAPPRRSRIRTSSRPTEQFRHRRMTIGAGSVSLTGVSGFVPRVPAQASTAVS